MTFSNTKAHAIPLLDRLTLDRLTIGIWIISPGTPNIATCQYVVLYHCIEEWLNELTLAPLMQTTN